MLFDGYKLEIIYIKSYLDFKEKDDMLQHMCAFMIIHLCK